MRGDRDGTAGFLTAGQRRGVFDVDEASRLAELERAWAYGGYHGFSAEGGTWGYRPVVRSAHQIPPGLGGLLH
jgi:hypothetical protein